MERKKLPFPCNLDESEKKYPHVNNKKQLGQFPCWFEYTLSSWLVLNKLKIILKFFLLSDKRITPWLYVDTLSGYF